MKNDRQHFPTEDNKYIQHKVEGTIKAEIVSVEKFSAEGDRIKWNTRVRPAQ